MFNTLDTLILPVNPRIVNGVTYTAWQPQQLLAHWNEYMNNKFYLALTKTTRLSMKVCLCCKRHGLSKLMLM